MKRAFEIQDKAVANIETRINVQPAAMMSMRMRCAR